MHRLCGAGAGLTTTSQPAGVPALVRDRLTWTVYALVGVYGYFLYGFGPSVSLLRQDQDVSRSVGALHGTALAAGAVVAGVAGAWMVRRFGRGTVLRGGAVGICLGIVLYCSSTALPVTLLGALVAGTAGSALLNTHAAVMSEHHGRAAPGAISEANACAAATGLLAPLAVGAAVALGLGWRIGLLVTVLLAAVVLLMARDITVPDALGPGDHQPGGQESGGQESGGQARRLGRLPAHYWPAWVVLVLCVAVEFSITIWASDLLRSRAGLGDGAAAAGLTGLVAGMMLGRAAGGRLALRRSPDALLLQALAVTGAGFAVFWISTIGLLSIAGLFIVGLGIALHFPLGITRVIAASGGRPDQATARASLGAGLAIGLAPWVLGTLADEFGTHLAFLLVPVLLVGATTTVLLRPTVPTAG